MQKLVNQRVNWKLVWSHDTGRAPLVRSADVEQRSIGYAVPGTLAMQYTINLPYFPPFSARETLGRSFSRIAISVVESSGGQISTTRYDYRVRPPHVVSSLPRWRDSLRALSGRI